MPSKHLILCPPFLLLPSVFPSIRVFSNELTLCIRWPKYWNFSFSISPSNENSGLTSFRADWFDLLAVQGTLRRLLQHHNSKASIYQVLVTQLHPTLWDPMDCSTLGFPVLNYLLEFAQIYVHWVGDAIQQVHPLLSLSPPTLILYPITVFSNELAILIRWPKYWNFSINPSNEYSGLISFRIDWFNLLGVQRTLKSLLQHYNSKASILPMNIRDWFPLGLTGLIALQSRGLSRVFSNTTVQKHQFFSA